MLVGARVDKFIRIDIDTESARLQRSELFYISADATTNVEDACVIEANIATDEVKMAVLSKAPNVRRVSEENRFVFLSHGAQNSRNWQ